jgi:PKD repeat protein
MQIPLRYYMVLCFLLLQMLVAKESFGGTNPTANFNVDNTTPVVGDTITFTNSSTNGSGTIDTWQWNFGTGASPASTTGVGPHRVSYSSDGFKTVSLYVETQSGRSNTEPKNDYINVGIAPTPGTIGTDQTICTGGTPNLLTSVADGGGTGVTGYEWQTNASGSWVTIPGEAASTYQPPALTATTSYRRRTVAVHGITRYSAYTTPVVITVVAQPVSPTIGKNPIDATVCLGRTLTVSAIAGTGGAGTVSDEYRYSTDNKLSWTTWQTTVVSFAAVPGINWIQSRRTATGNGCSASSPNELSWNVNDLPIAEILSPADGSSDCPQLFPDQDFNGATGALGYSKVFFTVKRPDGASTWAFDYRFSATNGTAYSGSPHSLGTLYSATGLTAASHDVEIWIENIEITTVTVTLTVEKIFDTIGCEGDTDVARQTILLPMPSIGSFN